MQATDIRRSGNAVYEAFAAVVRAFIEIIARARPRQTCDRRRCDSEYCVDCIQIVSCCTFARTPPALSCRALLKSNARHDWLRSFSQQTAKQNHVSCVSLYCTSNNIITGRAERRRFSDEAIVRIVNMFQQIDSMAVINQCVSVLKQHRRPNVRRHCDRSASVWEH